MATPHYSPPDKVLKLLLSPGYARVTVGPGVGLLDGGSEQDWPVEWLPPESRQPNAELWWIGEPAPGQPPRLVPVVRPQDARDQ
jgi:hypothetical protein